MGAAVATPLAIIASSIFSAKSWVYGIKWLISYVYIELFRRRTKRRFDLYDVMAEHDPYKVNFLTPPVEVALESPLPEEQMANTADEVFFHGTNSKSESLTVRLARGPDHESEAFVRLRMSDGRTYELREARGLQQSNCDSRVFSCGDLQLQHISPMRRWRIFFNGVMRDVTDISKFPKKMVRVKFVFQWCSSSDAFDFASDINSRDLATAFAKTEWDERLPPLEQLQSAMNCYTQAGIMHGNVTIDGSEDEYNIYLFGERTRFLGNTTLTAGMEFFQIIARTDKDGRFIYMMEVSIARIVETLRFGFLVQPTGQMAKISDADQAMEKLLENSEAKVIKTRFHADDKLYEMKAELAEDQAHFQSNKNWSGRILIDPINIKLNSFEGSGVVLKGKMKMMHRRSIIKPPTLQIPPVIPSVVHFNEEICQLPEITGGKGSSLGKLTELSKDFQNFVVPNGIVVTTAAYDKFISKEVIQEIKNLENCVYNNKCADIKNVCQKVIEKVISSKIPDFVQQKIVQSLKKEFPDNKNELKFAVRSSCTGEDTEQMSAAGQMETFLGVTGIDEILSAVKKCWASQFSHIAVEYKRQNGQPLNCPMAVVVQQMVSCDVAGVLFTCDPLTGDPTKMSVTANYGLGESVVSGSEEPDTIELKRNEDDKLSVVNKIIGSKGRRIVMQDGEGTTLQEVPEHERSACCLSDENAIRLGDIAVKLHKSYRSHRDIEWGYWNNNLYIFQSRPVTSGTGETDYEIDHEFDAPMRVENEFFTVANVGEVMPGATSPLGLEVIHKFFNIVFQRPTVSDWQVELRCQYFPNGMVSMFNHVMFYCVDLFRRVDDKAATEAGIVAMFGRLMDYDELYDLALLRHGETRQKRKSPVKELFKRFMRMFFTADKVLKQCREAYRKYRIPVEKCKTSQELFDSLMYACTDLSEVFAAHMVCSESSSLWTMIVFTVLRKANGGELNADVYADFASLVTIASDVESADVPASLEKLSSCIAKDVKPEDFKKMNAGEALKWLESSSSQSGGKYREFLQKHGHRCLKEFDVYSSTWQTEPKSLIQLLQNTIGNKKKSKADSKNEDFNTLISKMTIPLNFKQRLALRFLIPLSRKGVQHRENSKSLLIRALDAWRIGYTRLAHMMVEEGRIPEPDLLFFMRIEEIKELLVNRSPRIIARANHRRRRHPILDKYIFEEISKGVPVPINLDTQPIITSDDSLQMTGIPVSQGVTKGYVRVAVTLEEAASLQPGEILVTYSTDIGWSPYFPFLAGVVTELGGLISHGAVVSREYGIPCIAGLHGATRQFQTGDYALLNGNKGILQKLPKPETS
ncbi:hypothetical protein JTE90_021415 [Oedothorax gibbosus]|uniref:Phosphoenolpyruvate synthase n=1 Tax=Oedothorax gibbosus TaxID=931172 RepID=A0AAV6VEE6_9ARAC|nr:hypothetical protein JTE90_021415 [Oedothorax gibbosus]